jgi:hypothetical protein
MHDVTCFGSRPLAHRRAFLFPVIVAALALAGMSPSARAASADFPVPAVGAEVPMAPSPAQAPSLTLGMWTSRPGEAKEDFIRRVGTIMYAFTVEHGVETCGQLLKEKDGDRYRLPVVTNLSQIGCISVTIEDPDFDTVGETVHTHPRLYNITPSVQDRALFPGRGMSPKDRYSIENAQNFSKVDYAHGPGYVVVPGAIFFGPSVLYQHGPGEHRRVGGLVKHMTPDLAQPDASPVWLAKQTAPTSPSPESPASPTVAVDTAAVPPVPVAPSPPRMQP